MKKKWLYGCLVGALVVSLCACGSSTGSKVGTDSGSASANEASGDNTSGNEDGSESSRTSQWESLGLEYNDEVKEYISRGVYLRFAVPYEDVVNNAAFDWDTSDGFYLMNSEENCDSDYASVLCSFNSLGLKTTYTFKLYMSSRYDGTAFYPDEYDDTNKTVAESSSYTNANGLDAVVEKGYVQWTDDDSDGASHSFYYTDCYIDYGQDQDFFLMFVDLTEDASKADFIDKVMAATVESFYVEDTN